MGQGLLGSCLTCDPVLAKSVQVGACDGWPGIAHQAKWTTGAHCQGLLWSGWWSAPEVTDLRTWSKLAPMLAEFGPVWPHAQPGRGSS